jgi:predicted site-specific integrase-resolvase
MAIRHLNQIELAARWNISHRTLERWRWTGEGPQFIKIGGRVVYRLEDVEAFEANQLRASGSILTFGSHFCMPPTKCRNL